MASETRDVPVIIDPDLDTLGLHTQGYGGSAIYLREYDEQVLLHEALHVMLDPIIPYEGEGCLNHKVICAIEVGLTDAGWSLIDAATVAAQARAKAGEDIAAAIEAKAHDCSCDRGCCYLCCNSCRGGQHTNSGPWWEYEGAPVAARIARDLTRADTGEA